MFIATVAVTVALAAALVGAASRKLSHRAHVVESYARAGVPEDRLNLLAVVLLAGAAGLVLGLVWAPIGVAAAAGVVCYFIVAIAFHVRSRDVGNLPTPLALAGIGAVALFLRLATL